MSNEDKETFKQGRPYVVGLVALVMQLRQGIPCIVSPAPQYEFGSIFNIAESFVAEFEKRNGIK